MSEKFNILDEIFYIVTDRKANPRDGSYTNYLFDKGIDKICKKIGEEASEVIIAAKNNSPEEIRYEAADLLYHLTVLLVNQGLTWDEIMEELKKRR
ncbi:MAG TPA: phosphoribosyl-ATP diphosphatase [Clostridiaceae bacterium]|nr:phosphoribosyl-ATP diphosphatase [Clostridiaceae bacterium]